MLDFHVIKADRRWRNAERKASEELADDDGAYGSGSRLDVLNLQGKARALSDATKEGGARAGAAASLRMVGECMHPSPAGMVRVVSKRILAWRIGLLLVLGLTALPGSILAAPMFFITNRYSAKKASEAKAGSSVKIAGRDVVATWKLLVGLVVVPLMHAVYTSLAYLIGGQTSAVAFFFFAPFVCALSILATERGHKLLTSLKPIWIMMSNEKKSLRLLVETRRALAKHARSVIKKFNLDGELRTSSESEHLYRRWSVQPGTAVTQ